MPEKQQVLKRLLTLTVQYVTPQISFLIKTCLDSITKEVLFLLKAKYPAHSIFSTSSDQLSDWKNNNINDNFWDETEARQIINILQKFFSELNHDKLKQLLRTEYLNESKIFWLLTNFGENLLLFIYHSVARRLGIRCVLLVDSVEITNKIGNIIVWKPKYNTENLNNAECFVIVNDFDFYKFIEGRYNSLHNCLFRTLFSYEKIINWTIKSYISEQMLVFENYLWELEIIRKIINNEDVDILAPIKVRADMVRRIPKIRSKKIKFAIGMIVKHDDIRPWRGRVVKTHIGVIIGWHFKCKGEFVEESLSSIAPHFFECYKNFLMSLCESTCLRMYKCRHFNQVHYIILINGNKICYVQQDDISICPPQRIDNVEIGRYFSRFKGTHYVPNESLAEDYPEDGLAILNILSNTN
ncbi:uncharacterized protein [Anoplolepis gracilipes]|uniref:uncharacterized protein n=1 Tax=Anoplolepis gracilipes TaxID=354296 RepID=UPI003BA37D6B